MEIDILAAESVLHSASNITLKEKHVRNVFLERW
jgi:hypothetical protein